MSSETDRGGRTPKAMIRGDGSRGGRPCTIETPLLSGEFVLPEEPSSTAGA